jgi:hypothetical protein
MDAGYFSEENVLDLYDKKIDFLTRLPGGRKKYNEIILKKSKSTVQFNFFLRINRYSKYLPHHHTKNIKLVLATVIILNE